MEGFWEFLKVTVIAGAALLALFLVLLSLPSSGLGRVALRLLSVVFFAVTGASVLYVVVPTDLLPDVLPGVGWVDDAGALVTGIVSGLSGLAAYLGSAPRSRRRGAPGTRRG